MIAETRGPCAVAPWSGKPCAGEVAEVILFAGEGPNAMGWPDRLELCQYHQHLELLVWGGKAFFQKYPMSREKPRGKGASALTDFYQTSNSQSGADCGAGPRDPHLYFNAPATLETLRNADSLAAVASPYHWRAGYEHLKHVAIDLDQARLTDRQLTAVCLVFYGGVKKTRAAQAMNITSQALRDHIKAALKKIADKIR